MQKIRPILQHDFKDCGICCMQWIIIYYNGYISLEKLREDTLTNINGTSAYHIVNTFKKWGFDSMGILEHDIKNMNMKVPFIAHVKLQNGLEHFVVVREIAKDTIYLMDPGCGYRKQKISDFAKQFTGHVIISYPREKLIVMEKGLTLKELFLKIILKEKFLILKIIMASILLTIFSVIGSYYLKVGSNVLGTNDNYLRYLILIFGLLTIIKIVMYAIREYYENHLQTIVDTYLYSNFIKHIFYLPSNSIRNRTTGEIITRIREISNIKSLFSDILVSGFLDFLMVGLSMLILYFLNKTLFMILLIFIILYIIYGFFISKIIYREAMININYETDFNSVIIEDLNMLNSIKNLNVTTSVLTKLENVLSKYLFHNYKFNNFFNISNLGKDFLLEFCLLLINTYGFWQIKEGNLSLVDLFTFNIILGYCIDPVKNMINLLPKYNYIKVTYQKVLEFMNIEEEKDSLHKEKLKGDIIFQNVSFSYNNYNDVLKNVNFTIKNGEHVLLDGCSGSGKSTICKLIYKEKTIDTGCILIGNKNIKDLSLSVIRDNILYISQDEKLFSGTIRDNILINRKIDEEYFYKICSLCEVESILKKRNLRYDSFIEGQAENISGGERQRIVLARGLLKKANILILDEVLSEVEEKLENKIINNICAYFKDKTIIYISHKNQKKYFPNVIDLGGINSELLS